MPAIFRIVVVNVCKVNASKKYPYTLGACETFQTQKSAVIIHSIPTGSTYLMGFPHQLEWTDIVPEWSRIEIEKFISSFCLDKELSCNLISEKMVSIRDVGGG